MVSATPVNICVSVAIVWSVLTTQLSTGSLTFQCHKVVLPSGCFCFTHCGLFVLFRKLCGITCGFYWLRCIVRLLLYISKNAYHFNISDSCHLPTRVVNPPVVGICDIFYSDSFLVWHELLWCSGKHRCVNNDSMHITRLTATRMKTNQLHIYTKSKILLYSSFYFCKDRFLIKLTVFLTHFQRNICHK